jgi:hypothetical protein
MQRINRKVEANRKRRAKEKLKNKQQKTADDPPKKIRVKINYAVDLPRATDGRKIFRVGKVAQEEFGAARKREPIIDPNLAPEPKGYMRCWGTATTFGPFDPDKQYYPYYSNVDDGVGNHKVKVDLFADRDQALTARQKDIRIVYEPDSCYVVVTAVPDAPDDPDETAPSEGSGDSDVTT